MRISDWSSDVCSSDLPAPAGAGRGSTCLEPRHPGLVPGSNAPQTLSPVARWMPEQVRHDEDGIGGYCPASGRPPGFHSGVKSPSASHRIGAISDWIALVMKSKSMLATVSEIGRASVRERVGQYV